LTTFNLLVNVHNPKRFVYQENPGPECDYPGRSLLLSLPELLPPVHFNTITTLDIEWMVEVSTGGPFFLPMPAYTQGWQILSSMKGLTRLYVHLSSWEIESEVPKGGAELWLKPIRVMKQAKNLNKFHLCVGESFFRIFREETDPCYVLDFAKDTFHGLSGKHRPRTAGLPYDDWRDQPLVTEEELLREYNDESVTAKDRYRGRFINTPDEWE
jgi:hypothetical protein